MLEGFKFARHVSLNQVVVRSDCCPIGLPFDRATLVLVYHFVKGSKFLVGDGTTRIETMVNLSVHNRSDRWEPPLSDQSYVSDGFMSESVLCSSFPVRT